MTRSNKTYSVSSGKAASDKDMHDKKEEIPLAEQLLYAKKITGKGIVKTALEFRKCSRGRAKLTPSEFIDFGAFEADDDQQNRYISAFRHWPIVHTLNDRSLFGLTEDKWLADHFMELGKIPRIPILAMIDKSARDYFGTPVIRDERGLEEFLNNSSFPIFAKHNSALWSIGAIRIVGWSENYIELSSGEKVSIVEFLENWIGDEVYLLQHAVANHHKLSSFASGLITVRVGFFREDDNTVYLPGSVLKLPRHGNIAYNFWREGNQIASVEVDSGKIGVFRERFSGRIRVAPEQPSLSGSIIPFWEKLPNIIQRCAEVFHFVNYGSLDVAITDEGPVVVEVNSGGAWELFQYATRTGFLTDKVLDLFKLHGVEL